MNAKGDPGGKLLQKGIKELRSFRTESEGYKDYILDFARILTKHGIAVR